MNIFGFTISYAHIIYTLILIVLGFLISYYKTNAKFRSFIATLINDAQSLDKTGTEKKEWVVGQIYTILPAWLKPILTKTVLSMIVQGVFDSMKQYATKLTDKAIAAASEEVTTLKPIGTVSTDVPATASTGADQAAKVKQSSALSSEADSNAGSTESTTSTSETQVESETTKA